MLIHYRWVLALCSMLAWPLVAVGQQLAPIAPRVVVAHQPNSIDSLQTTQQVEQWIRRTIRKNYFYPAFEVDTLLINYGAVCQQVCAGLPVRPYVKVDMDGNGYTDLLVYRRRHFGRGRSESELYLIKCYGPRSFVVEYVQGRGSGSCQAAAVVQLEGRPALIYQHDVTPVGAEGFAEQMLPQTDTLVHRFGDLVEYNRQPEAAPFQRLEARFGYDCCARFAITLFADRKVLYEETGQFFDYQILRRPPPEIFTSTLDSAAFEQIASLFQYIKPSGLAPDYAVNWTDAGTAWLSVAMQDGRALTIKDYGEQGTWGLSRLYALLAGLRTQQHWQSITRPYNVPAR